MADGGFLGLGMDIYTVAGIVSMAMFFGFSLIWFRITWQLKGLVLSIMRGNPFDMNIDEFLQVRFSPGEIKPGGFLVSAGVPKKVRPRSSIQIGNSRGILTYGDVGLSLRPEELAALSNLHDNEPDKLRSMYDGFDAGIPGHIGVQEQVEDDEPNTMNTKTRNLVARLAGLRGVSGEGEDVTAANGGVAVKAAIKEKKVSINPCKSIRISDVVQGLSDDPSTVLMENYKEEGVMEALKDAQGSIWSRDLIMGITFLMMLVLIAYMIIEPGSGQQINTDELAAKVKSNIGI